MTISKIELTWTPNAQAVSQEVQRALSSSGPWTTIATLSGTASSYTDNTVVSNPHTDYFYRIETTCSAGVSYGSVVQEEARCCPTDNDVDIFKFRDTTYDTVGSAEGPVTAETHIQYKDGLNTYLNNNYNTSKTVDQTKQVRKLATGSNPSEFRAVACHVCSQQFSYDTTTTGTSTNTGQVSLSYNQSSLISQFPTPPSSFGGSHYNNLGKYWAKKTQSITTIAPINNRFQLGITNSADGSTTFRPWGGRGVYLQTATRLQNANNAPTSDWNFGAIPVVNPTTGAPNGQWQTFKSVQLPKSAGSYNTSDPDEEPEWTTTASGYTLRDFSTGLQSIPQTSTLNNIDASPYCIAFMDQGYVDINNALRCQVFVYRLSRNTNFDYYNSNNVLTHYGFDLSPEEFNFQWKEGAIQFSVTSQIPYQTDDFLPYNYNGSQSIGADQTNTILKIFQPGL